MLKLELESRKGHLGTGNKVKNFNLKIEASVIATLFMMTFAFRTTRFLFYVDKTEQT